jgi:Na+/glutamate symporter
VVILVSGLTIGLAGATDVSAGIGAAGMVAAASAAVGLVTASLDGALVCATAKPIVATRPSALAEEIKNFDTFMVKLH